jgi:hypothetical protein
MIRRRLSRVGCCQAGCCEANLEGLRRKKVFFTCRSHHLHQHANDVLDQCDGYISLGDIFLTHKQQLGSPSSVEHTDLPVKQRRLSISNIMELYIYRIDDAFSMPTRLPSGPRTGTHQRKLHNPAPILADLGSEKQRSRSTQNDNKK